MLANNEGNCYAFLKEQMQLKGSPVKNNNSNLDAIEKRLLEMVDSLKIAKYKPKDEDIF